MPFPESSTNRSFALAALPVAAYALYQVNWPKTVFRFVFTILAPTKERFFPSDDTSLSPRARGAAWVLLNGPAPHDVGKVRAMMAMFWPNVWSAPPSSIQITTGGLVPGQPETMLIWPENPIDGYAVLHIHGGGLIAGTTGMESGMAVELAKKLNAPVLSVDYRLVPEFTAENAVDDCVAAYEWFLSKFPDRQMSFFGGSAGACLSLLTSIRLKQLGKKLPISMVLGSAGPALEFLPPEDKDGWPSLKENAPNDGLMAGEFYQWVVSIVYGSKENTNYFRKQLQEDLKGLPPSLVTAGGYEILLGGIHKLRDSLTAAQVDVEYREWAKMQHVHYILFEIVPESVEALNEIVAWLKKSWNK